MSNDSPSQNPAFQNIPSAFHGDGDNKKGNPFNPHDPELEVGEKPKVNPIELDPKPVLPGQFILEVQPMTDLGKLPEDTLLQSRFWALHKSRFGWQPFGFLCTWRTGNPEKDSLQDEGLETGGHTEQETLLVLVRKFRFGLRLAYVPHGPRASAWKKCFGAADARGIGPGSVLQALGVQISEFLPNGVFCLRFDPDWTGDFIESKPGEIQSSDIPSMDLYPLEKALSDIQPPDTVILDLEPGTEEILSAMKSKHRYNIRLATKKNVQVTIHTIDQENFPSHLSAWYNLYGETAKRDGITIHSYNYYLSVFQSSQVSGKIRIMLLQAHHEEDYLAGIILALSNNQATYLYGASSNTKRNLMPAYALQWEAILLAKKFGVKQYDLFGIPPSPDPKHPMHGLYQFKTGFGGTIIHYPGCWDFPTQPLVYWFYRRAEKIRRLGVYLRKK